MKLRSSISGLALAVGLGVMVAGCGQVNQVRAQKAFKDANKLYAASDWRAAATKYEEALQLNPENAYSHFFLANSLDNLYRPTRVGEPENDALLTKAIENYRLAGEQIDDPLWKRRSLEFLVSAYGPDKLNDPTMAEPIVKQMIALDPEDPANYFQLAQIYENSGEYELAEETFLKAKQAKPSDPAVYMQLAGYYNRQGEFDKTIDALSQRVAIEPNNPEAHYTVSTYYWDKAYRDFRLKDAEKLDMVMKGLESVDKAIEIKSDYMEAIAYKNLLLRLEANLIKDPRRQQALIREADELRDKAEAMRKAKNTSAS
ncbi:MAG: tetratricopeptide repeat protein [Acidobacteria bacterium]|nr:tetratricopeptide repeat protein [Acidobacteriota bacterium]